MIFDRKGFKYIALNTIILNTLLLGCGLFADCDLYVKYIQAIATAISFFIMLLHTYKIYNSAINFHSIILMGFYVFFMGRQFTSLFGFDSYLASRYSVDFSISDYSFAFLFSYCCIYTFYIFSIYNFKPQQDREPHVEAKQIQEHHVETEQNLYKVFQLVFVICVIPMSYYYYTLISSAMVSKYGSDLYDSLVTSSGYLIGLLHRWGLLSLIGILCFQFVSQIKINKLYLVIYLSFTIISLFSGGRTEGMSLLLVLVLLYSEKSKGKSRTQIYSIVAMLGIAILAPYLFEIRKDLTQITNIEISDFANSNSILKAIHEMGGSVMPFMYVVSLRRHIYGRSYVFAILNTAVNFLPKSIRPVFEPTSLAHYFTVQMNLNAGLGFNLVAESYYNFSYFGVLVFAFLGYSFRNIIRSSRGRLGFIKNIMFVFLMFTMARRESKDLFSGILYYWLPFVALINIVERNSLKKLGDLNEESI